jgi:hypothetical protein
MNSNFTSSDLKQVMSYDPETGIFTVFPRRGTKGGLTRGSLNPNGAYVFTVAKKLHYAHRLAWLYMTGEWPGVGIDHKDCNPQNNRWDNLRLADQSENNMNARKRSGTSSKFKGVYFHAAAQKWGSQIHKNGKNSHLGLFETEQEAHNAYSTAAEAKFGEFARPL